MTISFNSNKAGPYIGNGSTTSFSLGNIKVLSADDLVVVRRNADETESVLVKDSDYTVSLNLDQESSPGGSITYPTVASGDAPMTSSEYLTILRQIDEVQSSDITNLGGFYPDIIETMADRAVMMAQQNEERLLRALHLSKGATDAQVASMELPASTRSKYLYIGSTGLLETAIAADGAIPITAQSIGQLIFPRTQAEIDVLATPIDYTKFPSPVLDLSRHVSDNEGLTDVRAEFQTAINVNKNELAIPDGTYLIDGSLNPKDRSHWKGSGYDTILKLADGADVPLIQFASTANDFRGVVLENFRIEGNSANQTDAAASGMFLTNVTGTSGLLARHLLRDLWIHNCKGNGLHLGFAMRSCVVENVNVYKADEYGIRGQAFSDSMIAKCIVGQSGKNGFHLTGCGDLGVSQCKSWFSGRIDNLGNGYYIDDCGSFAGTLLKSQNNEGDGFYCIGNSSPLDGLVLSGCTADADNKSAGGYGGMQLVNVNKGNVQLAVRNGNANADPAYGVKLTAATVNCQIDLTCDGQTGRAVDGTGIGSNLVRVNGNPMHFTTFRDDFVGDVIADQWGNAAGSDPQVVAPSIVAGVAGGVCRLVTGDDAAASMAVNGVQLHSALQWRANTYGVGFDCYIKLSAITNVALFVGFTDQIAALEMPFTLGASDALTSNASDAVGFLFDTAADTDNWWGVGVAADVDATHFDTASAPVAATYQRLQFSLSNAGAAAFFIDGVQVGSTLSAAVTATTVLTPVIAAFSRGAASRNIDVDAITVKALRA